MAPRALAGPSHSLPPMLHKWCRRAMSGCSKGARGLFVLSRVLGILTETPISPSLWRRQRPSRYAIRAGRNLPDKEFRYLRTVIVTAAVYRGFDSELHPCGLTPPLNLPAPGRRQCLYVVLHDFADTCVFAKQSLGPILCGRLPLTPAMGRSSTTGSPSPEVTGTFCRVPSPQFTRAPEASRLAYVCPFAVRSQDALPAEAFLGSLVGQTPEGRTPPSASGLGYPGLLSPGTAYLLAPGRPSPGPAFTPASPLRVVTHILWCGNVRPLPIVYALRPRLRVRLTQGGRACPWKP
jgi:hypothetical protein